MSNEVESKRSSSVSKCGAVVSITCKESAIGSILGSPIYPCMLLSLADCATDDFGTACYTKRGWLLPSTMTIFLRILESKWKLDYSSSPNVILWNRIIPFDDYALPNGEFYSTLHDVALRISRAHPTFSTSTIIPCSEFTVVLVLLCLITNDDTPTVIACFTLFNGNIIVAILDSCGNSHGAKGPVFQEALQQSLLKINAEWRGNVTLHPELNKSKTYQAEPYKDAGLVCIDILDTLLGSTTSAYISSCKLAKDGISKHIYHCFEQKLVEGKAVSFKWSTIKERRSSRASLGALFMRDLEWTSFDEALAVVVRRHLKICRPLVMVKSVYAALQLRCLHDQYAVVPLTKVLSFKKGRIVKGNVVRPSGYTLSKKKLVSLLSESLGTDRFRIAIWYNDNYGFICPKFRDYQKHKKDVMLPIGGLKDEGAASDSATSAEDGCVGDDGRPAKRRKVERLQGLKVYVDFDEGFDDDETGFYNLYAQNYGSMFMLPEGAMETKAFTDTEFALLRGTWVILERIYETSESLVAPGRHEDTMFIDRVKPIADVGVIALCYDLFNHLWRECSIVSVDCTLVPPTAKVKLAETHVVMDVLYRDLRVL
jgi:hypothetical protein